MNPSKEQSESLPETIPGLLAGFARELRCSIW
jgi:hypothetical protein